MKDNKKNYKPFII